MFTELINILYATMENEIYKILKKHKLQLKKREEVLSDLLFLFSVNNQKEQLLAYEKWRNGHVLNATDEWHQANVELFLNKLVHDHKFEFKKQGIAPKRLQCIKCGKLHI